MKCRNFAEDRVRISGECDLRDRLTILTSAIVMLFTGRITPDLPLTSERKGIILCAVLGLPLHRKLRLQWG
jgi:hypothetical protein